MGGHDAGRRSLRGQRELLSPGTNRSGLLQLQVHRAHPSGARGRKPDQPTADRARGHYPRQHVLHHHPVAPRTERRHLRGRDRGRSPRPRVHVSVQGQRGPGQAGQGGAGRGRGQDPLRVHRHLRKHGGRAAHLLGQLQGASGLLPGQGHHDRARHDPGGGKRLLHPATGRGLQEHPGEGHR